MKYDIDINENDILALGHNLLQTLLCDRTTGKNIFWATDDYSDRGVGYTFFDNITIEAITGEHNDVIMPRIAKDKEKKKERKRKMAEVFTPSWLCNRMLDDVDARLFGRNDVFNTKNNMDKEWHPVEAPVVRDGDKITWDAYVKKTVMEITCGEGPFIVSRYDTVSGRRFDDVNMRVGFLDRKLRLVTENTHTKEEWMEWVKTAYQCSYGYEWQGDNLLIARQNLLFTLFDYFEAVWNEEPPMDFVEEIAYIISWNLWQMDGLKNVLPRSCKTIVEETTDLFGNVKRKEKPCEGCEKKLIHKHNGIYAKIMDWKKGKPILFDSLSKDKNKSDR